MTTSFRSLCTDYILSSEIQQLSSWVCCPWGTGPFFCWDLPGFGVFLHICWSSCPYRNYHRFSIRKTLSQLVWCSGVSCLYNLYCWLVLFLHMCSLCSALAFNCLMKNSFPLLSLLIWLFVSIVPLFSLLDIKVAHLWFYFYLLQWFASLLFCHHHLIINVIYD